MNFVEWSEEYNTGIPDIDKEHRMLFALINDLYDKVRAGSAETSINATIEALVDYVDYHFSREESLLKVCNYPDLDTHIAAHRKLQAQLQSCQRNYESDPVSFDVNDFMNFLTGWLQGHILQSDMAYLSCVRRRVSSIVEGAP